MTLYKLIQPHINNVADKFIPPHGSEQSDVDLNQILQTVCSRCITEGKSFILRADKLPHVQGKEEIFLHLFGELISMILNHPPQNSKLFLYITCKEQPPDADTIDLRLIESFKLFKIDFHTNITSDDQWINLYKANLAKCSLLVQQAGNSFSFFPICNTGCLFSISLPGKIQ